LNFSRTLLRARLMITFAKIVEAGGVSAAAAQMGIDKGAVSRQLRDLEDQLGVMLLHRTTRQQVLTEAGLAVFDRAKKVVHEVEYVRTEAEGFSSRVGGVLTVSASVAFGKLQVIPLLGDFVKQYPDIEIQICLLDRQVDPVEEGMDILLRLCDIPPNNLASHFLCDIAYAIVASPEHAGNIRVDKPSDLITQNCLFYGFKNTQSVWRFQRDDREEIVQVHTKISVNSSEAVRDLAVEGVGVALLPGFAVADDLRSGRLVRLLESHEVHGNLGDSLFAIYLPGRFSSPKVRAFVEFLHARWAGEDGPPWKL
jgi:DNA-binding transcriptional LysR family regulator